MIEVGFIVTVSSWAQVYNLDRSTIHPKFKQTRVRNHDLQITDNIFDVVVTTEPSGTIHIYIQSIDWGGEGVTKSFEVKFVINHVPFQRGGGGGGGGGGFLTDMLTSGQPSR